MFPGSSAGTHAHAFFVNLAGAEEREEPSELTLTDLSIAVEVEILHDILERVSAEVIVLPKKDAKVIERDGPCGRFRFHGEERDEDRKKQKKQEDMYREQRRAGGGRKKKRCSNISTLRGYIERNEE